jgi:hypothetical protein
VASVIRPSPGDELFIVCEVTTANGSPTYYDAYASVASKAEGAPVWGNLPKEQVQRLDGGSLRLYYNVNGLQPSDTLHLSVGVAAPSLPKPTVVEADARMFWTANALPTGLLSFTANAKYGDELTSDLWGFTVQSASVELRINRVDDGNGIDTQNGSTNSYSMPVLHGVASSLRRSPSVVSAA